MSSQKYQQIAKNYKGLEAIEKAESIANMSTSKTIFSTVLVGQSEIVYFDFNDTESQELEEIKRKYVRSLKALTKKSIKRLKGELK